MAPPTSWNCQIFVFKTTPSEKNYQNRLVPLPKEQLRIFKAKFATGINLPKLRCENIFPTFKILFDPQAPVAQKIADEVVFRRFQGEGVEFF